MDFSKTGFFKNEFLKNGFFKKWNFQKWIFQKWIFKNGSFKKKKDVQPLEFNEGKFRMARNPTGIKKKLQQLQMDVMNLVKKKKKKKVGNGPSREVTKRQLDIFSQLGLFMALFSQFLDLAIVETCIFFYSRSIASQLVRIQISLKTLFFFFQNIGIIPCSRDIKHQLTKIQNQYFFFFQHWLALAMSF